MPSISHKSSRAIKCVERYGNEAKFLSTFNPGNQYVFCRDVDRCFTGTAPTIKDVSEAYKEKVAESWIAIQLKDLSEFVGNKDKMSTSQIDQVAKVILVTFPFLKVTELMYFFLLFKSGKYGKFYGAVDGLAITEALQEFCVERREKLWKLEQRRKQEERKRQELEHSKHAMTYEEWQELKWLFNMGYEPERIKAELEEQKKSK